MNPNFVLPKIGEMPILASIESICKFEKVPTRICAQESDGVLKAADIVINAIKEHKGDKPFVLGLSTGRTPLGLYNELVKRYNAGEVSFANVVVYSLDEFYPIDVQNPVRILIQANHLESYVQVFHLFQQIDQLIA